ncbi:MAG: DUF4835 family protein [Chitinophagales bacterium]
MMYKFLTLLCLFFICQKSFAQELNCEVSVVAPDASKIKADPKVFKTLENTIFEFMNNRKWTTESFEDFEKIDCSIFIGIKSQSGDRYTASITVISKRPVFNSDYKTTVLNIIDNDFVFDYKEFEPIEFAENQFISNLSHVLAFYANMIIAMDYETFSENGGEKYLVEAQNLLNLVSVADSKIYLGWKATDKNKRSKYWLVTHTLNTRYLDYRKAFYQYHRLGLDTFYTDEKLARKNIVESLDLLAKISADNPNISIMQMWSETKSSETIKIFKGAPTDEKTGAVNVLRKVDPVNANDYNAILK